ncbi:hypothetical protein [Listeria booriae]|uniref:hypothetical protein n=1 Tax=Listeria booriae TaxID=1552123 RepID=UPI0016278F03|nr:hypothetical protein [Listeria booriae]MBC2069323.1 hypothetical protein [Listeria booriae]MBC6301521.1 hypothetical protein [Listeria booriae]
MARAMTDEVLNNIANHVLENLEGSGYKPETDEDLMAIVELVKEDIDYSIKDGKVTSEGGIWVASVIEERSPHITDEYEGYE